MKMENANSFDLLYDDDNEYIHHLVQKLPQPTSVPKKPAPAQAQPAKNAKLPSKPLPPAQAVREAQTDGPRGGGRFGGLGAGRGRGGQGYNRGSPDNDNSYESNNGFSEGYNWPSEEGDVEKSSERRGNGAPRGGFRGGARRGGYSNGGDTADIERPRRVYDRHSGTGRGGDKRDGAGRGNWGTNHDHIAMETEELVIETEDAADAEKPAAHENAADATKENPEKEPEENEMTLEEYKKVLEEKRKALFALKAEERKVVLDKDFETMQVLSSKKSEEEIFVKLGTDKDKRNKAADKEERLKKSLAYPEFLKPAVPGGKYYYPSGRGLERGRGPRGGGRFKGGRFNDASAPSIGDANQFPSLGVK